MIAIIDYNAGNIFNAQKAFEYLGYKTVVSDQEKVINNASAIVLPGVGAFPDAMENLKSRGLDEIIKAQVKKGKPFLGICLGMQLLFERGYEGKECDGLSLIKGEVKRLDTTLKIPHMGWNSLNFHSQCRLFNGVQEGSFVYFVHSYCGVLKDEADLAASTDYGVRVVAAVCRDNVMGTQFHPEKSSEVGLKIIKNFGEMI